jgi:S-adenosyl-L-methionine hydrolase (adenosine-forming)
VPTITLLTDFGTADSYVAEVKGVLLTSAPGVTVVDVSHDVPPGAVATAQYLLSRAWRRFPPGTVHLTIVDPGVGTARRGLAAEAAGHRFVAADNGVLTILPEDARFVVLAPGADAAATFHGRDVFAPAAARLAGGARLEDLGAVVTDPLCAPLPAPEDRGTHLAGVVLHVDRFGNLVTNLPAAWGRAGNGMRAAGVAVGPLRRTFGDVEPGQLVAYEGSGGMVEVAVRDGSAARLLGAGIGAAVTIEKG